MTIPSPLANSAFTRRFSLGISGEFTDDGIAIRDDQAAGGNAGWGSGYTVRGGKNMHRIRALGLFGALAASAGPLVAADPPANPAAPATPTPDKPAPSQSLMEKWFSPKPKPAPPTAPMRPTVVAPLPRDVLVAALDAEQKALTRRMDICLRLKEIAIEKGDDALSRRADELERQATALYNQRVAALGVPKVPKAPLPESSAALALDKQLGTGAAVNPLTAAPAPTPDTAARTADSSARTQIHEVKQ